MHVGLVPAPIFLIAVNERSTVGGPLPQSLSCIFFGEEALCIVERAVLLTSGGMGRTSGQ